MSGSNLTPFNFIPENSLATPGLWNSVFSTLSQNIAEANTGSVLSGGISLGTQGLTINVSSNVTDYIFLNDSANLRSSYVIGSFTSGTADGLNIWDASGQTMLVSFSKQSIRFFQQVVGPVFDVGGALADTLNAATFGTGADSDETRIQAAINAAALASISRVYLPASMYPYSASSVSFIHTVQMVREGGNWDVCDIQAYGAFPTLAHSSNSAIQAAIRSGASQARVVYFPAGSYSVTTLSYYSGSVLRGAAITQSGSPPVQLYQSSASGPILQPADPTNPTSDLYVEDLVISAFGNTNNLGGIDCPRSKSFYLHRVVFSGTSSFAIRVTGGDTAGIAGFGAIDGCVFGALAAGSTALLLVSSATDQPDGVLFTNNYFSISNNTAIASLSSFTRGVDTFAAIANRIESSGTHVSIITGYFSAAKFVANRVETTNSNGTLHVTLNPSSVGGTVPCATFVANTWAFPGKLVWNDGGAARAPRWLENWTGSVNRTELWDGTAINPAYSFASESSLGLYRSAASTLALSYGTLAASTLSGIGTVKAATLGASGATITTSGVSLFLTSPTVLVVGTDGVDAGGSSIFRVNGQTALLTGNPINWKSGGVYSAYIVGDASNTSLRFATSFVEKMMMTNTALVPLTPGLLSLGTAGTPWSASFVSNGATTAPAYAFGSESSLGWYRSAASVMALSYGGLGVKNGTNASFGTATLGSNGSVNVATTYVAAGDVIFLTDQTAGGTLGDIEIGGIRAGSGFTIQSTSITDTSTVGWLIVRAAV